MIAGSAIVCRAQQIRMLSHVSPAPSPSSPASGAPVSISSPVNMATVVGTVAVTGTATLNAGDTLELLVGGELIDTAASSPSSFRWDSRSVKNGTPYPVLTVQIVNQNGIGGAEAHVMVHVENPRASCWLLPVRWGCMTSGTGHENDRIRSNINNFYNTSGAFSYFDQIKSIYNPASASATLSADLATLNFFNGMQLIAGTNVQAGSSGSSAPVSGTLPVLSSDAAAQAAQNVLYGGTLFTALLYPLLALGADNVNSAGNFGVLVDVVGKAGADIQNFKSGTNTNVTAPPFHGSGQIEGYLQYNSINMASNSNIFAGAIFLGGSYGPSYMSSDYARDYGFKHMWNGTGRISFGVLINDVAKIEVSRGFGPSQTFVNSATMLTNPATVDNFKSWSIGITYQTKPQPK